MKAIIYHNPKCSKSRFALEYLEKRGVDIDVRLYMVKGITRAEIYDILELLNGYITDILREKEQVFVDQYSSKGMELSKEGFINAITESPILLQRPIILFKEQVIGAVVRSEDSLESLFEFVGIKDR